MSNPQALLASARSAYRSALRASASTFRGDTVVRNAFRAKIRYEILPYNPQIDAKQFEEKVTLVKEIADVLRKNVVQARKVEEAPSPDEKELWELEIREETERGSNETIKQAKKPASQQTGRVNPEDSEEPSQADSETKPSVPRNYSQLKKAHKARVVPELREEDLEESFVRGSGPGGQSVNKTENNVQLLHKPTGLRVACQETRSLKQNRKIARKILLQKLDALYNPGLSKQDLQRAKMHERERQKRKKAKKKQKQKEKEAQGDADDAETSEH
ncbi:hypothetical protein PYCCODRAFT_1440000 [Trametes coccinea BRFM310]|uniref:Prokaryotic-type class I peptide chain release factors domain-containing protein n=1 Tax=Trametes coccinea (strain BRFM310) TaxID=1353009 RepID=A0A1Y2I920_TRAC3|nr:hypothetical protein PYCCODRAFT_1440000 [Trametes coccinea BRFM310]